LIASITEVVLVEIFIQYIGNIGIATLLRITPHPNPYEEYKSIPLRTRSVSPILRRRKKRESSSPSHQMRRGG
jgi:hypothetical protein